MGNEIKRIKVRKAKPGDHGLFKSLWMELLEAQAELGSTIIPNEHNVEAVMSLFNAYVSGDLDGVVLFVANVGVLMYGDMSNPFETTLGTRAAFGYGQYVKPDHRGRGILDAMMKEALTELKAMGFDVLHGATLEKDSHGLEAYTRGVKQNGSEVESTGELSNFVRLKE